jgi:hypothetical protein
MRPFVLRSYRVSPTFVVILLILMSLPSFALTANTRLETESLHGVTPIYISISNLPQWVVDQGITRMAIREAIESVLKSGGIAISDVQADTGGAFSVIIDGSAGKSTDGKYVLYEYLSNVALYQNVRLIRKDNWSLAITWSQVKMGGSASRKEAALFLLDDLEHAAQAFVADYHSANSR